MFRVIAGLTAVTYPFFCQAQGASPDRRLFGPNRNFQLEYSADGFGLRSQGVEELEKGRWKNYPLPQSSFRTYAQLRPEDLKLNPFGAKDYERQEVIGPHQVEGSKLWFGKDFYDSEGMRGVGAFGYFDTETRQYQLFSPRKAARFETSAIFVEKENVWLGLDQFIEDISTAPGGLVCWNRETHQVRRYPSEFVVTAIHRRGESLYLATNGGFALLRNDQLRRFAVRKGRNGAAKAVRIGKFPPPPSYY